MNKYKSKKITSPDGILFDSKKEYKRWIELQAMEKCGMIKDLQRQVEFELIPQQREPDSIGKRGGVIKGKVIEQKCCYKADFTYTVCETGQYVVEDTKGFRTKDYIIKRKLLLWKFGIKLKEI